MKAPDPYHWTLNSYSIAFRNFWVHLGPFPYCMKLGANRAELVQLMHITCNKIASEFFAMKAPDPYHWTLNSCFGALLSGWGHLELFCYCMKLATKRAKLVQVMQKFMPRCLVRSFCNERSRSTPLDPKLMFGCVSPRSAAFWNSFATARNLVQNTPNWCN